MTILYMLYFRDEAQAKMILLKEKADKDLQQHNAEMKELLRVIDHDRHLREFMGIKGQERQEDPQLVAWRQKKGNTLSSNRYIISNKYTIFKKHIMLIDILVG